MWLSRVPWLRFRRTTSTPARSIASSTAGGSLAGPSVATIFVRASIRDIYSVVELLLVRHALPVRRELEVGIADPELSADGLRQAEHLADYLGAEQLDAVYASPLRRARQTAQPVAERFGLDVQIEDAVAEWDRHSNEYVPIEELKAAGDPRWQAMLRGEWTVHDESPEQFAARHVDAVEPMIGAHRG